MGQRSVWMVCRSDSGGGMRVQPFGLSVGLRWGHETCEGCADMGSVVACERSRWGFRWNHWGHEACEACADMGA
eukprot:5394892-Pyramimonas_sp.AAC.1